MCLLMPANWCPDLVVVVGSLHLMIWSTGGASVYGGGVGLFAVVRYGARDDNKVMDIQNEQNHVFNIKLAKLIGLYQILDPGTTKCRGRNVYHIIGACILLYMCICSMILKLNGVFYWSTNMPLSIDYISKAAITLYLVYRMWNVVHRSNDIWNCLSITRYDFTSFSSWDKHTLDSWRGRSVWLTNIYFAMYVFSMVIYVTSSLAYRNDVLPVKNRDGSIGFYRQNAMNFYFIVSDQTYNTHYYTFYFFEVLFIGLMAMLFFTFDILLITLCFAICCQMQMICSAFESVGNKSLCVPHSPFDYTYEQKKTHNKHNLVYDDLKTILMDHQAVLQKYADFLTLFRLLMLQQIFVSSLSVITLWFLSIMSSFNIDKLKDSNVALKRMMCGIPALTYQLFLMCYLFGNLHNQKESIIFSLYSSNWTEMNMKCKKLILLIMQMNNANEIKLKFTRTKIVNLEMFFKTMGNCYTVVSVLLQYMINNKNLISLTQCLMSVVDLFCKIQNMWSLIRNILLKINIKLMNAHLFFLIKPNY
ncbi:hypothetical protein ACI65C_003263 [Semiaphis heraclei]